MKTIKIFVPSAVALLAFNACNSPCCINFNHSTTFPTGITYRAHNDSLTTACGFEVRTDNLYLNGIPYYNFGTVGAPPIAFGSGNVLNTNNITLRIFSFSPLQSSTINFDFLDMGGSENLAINGVIYSGELKSAPANLGGAAVIVSSAPVPLPASGIIGRVTIIGTVDKFSIGGQEFYIDNICWQ